jgi:hypothetical protein
VYGILSVCILCKMSFLLLLLSGCLFSSLAILSKVLFYYLASCCPHSLQRLQTERRAYIRVMFPHMDKDRMGVRARARTRSKDENRQKRCSQEMRRRQKPREKKRRNNIL